MCPADRLVYSTRPRPPCRICGKGRAACRCSTAPRVPAGDGVVRVGRSTKGRRGKGVTTVTGVPLAGDDLTALAKELKRLCGSGGTLKDGVIEVQGDHRDRLVEELTARGWTVKRSGG